MGRGSVSFSTKLLRTTGVFRDAVLAILATVAKQERIRMSERVQAGLSRARAKGKILGRPKSLVNADRILQLHQTGMSIRKIAKALGASPMTVHRILAPAISSPLSN